MRCSRTSCGKEGNGKFCEECGGKMVAEKMDTVVICSGKLKDDCACGAELVANQKFCKFCGTKVNQSLFHSQQQTCPQCGEVVEQDALFCMDCGQSLAATQGTDLKQGVDIRPKDEVMECSENDENLSKTAENQQKAAENRTGERSIKVKFHVLTSEDFEFDPQKDKCILVIGNAELGGWNTRNRLMKDKRKIETFVYEMVHEEVIPTRLIAGGQSIPYKYMIIRKEKESWEHYSKDTKAGFVINRDLKVTMRLKGLDIWHQFDCFMEHEPKSMTEKLFGYFNWRKTLTKHAEKAIQIFCPIIVEQDKSHIPIHDVIQLFKMASGSIRKIYYVDGKCWHDQKEYSNFIGTTVLKAMIEKWMPSSETDRSVDQHEKSTAAALTILYVSNALELGMPDPKSIHILTKALIMTVDNEKKECPDLNLADKLFPEKRKSLLIAIKNCAKNIMDTSKDPCWLMLMPWIHFLSGQCVPFEPPEMEVKHDSEAGKWWGITSIKKELDVFKSRYGKWEIPMENILKHLKALFEMDYLLPRTLIAAVDLEDLQGLFQTNTIPVEVCIANMVFQLRTYKPTTFFHHEYNSWRFPYMSSAEKVTQECVNTLLKLLQETFFSDECSLTQWSMCFIIASQMFKESLNCKRTETIYFCVQIFLHCIAIYDKALSSGTVVSNKPKENHLAVLSDALKETVRWLETYYHRWNIYMENILIVWDNVFAPVHLQSEEIRNLWNKDLSEALVVNLQRKVCCENRRMKEFVQLYCQKLDTFNPYMQECMGKAAFLAIQKGYTLDYGDFTMHEKQRFGMLLSNLFLAEWKKRVHAHEPDREQRILRYSLTWPPLIQYLKIYYKDGKRIGMLTDECIQYLVQAVSVIESKVSQLLSGALTIGELNMINEKDSKFPELAQLLKEKKEHTAASITKAIEIRRKELEAFQLQANEMATLASVCTQLNNIDRKCIDDTLQKQEDLETHQVKEFCEPADITKVDIVETYQPRLCAFKVSPLVIDVVPQLHACFNSSTFMMLWNAHCREVFDQCSTLDDVVLKVWSFVKNQWDKITNKIQSGNIKFQDFEKLVGQKYRDNYDQMKAELRTMNILDKVIEQRIDQLRKYRQLETCVKGAKTILKFAKEYNLNGDFSQIRVIAKHWETDHDMKSFDNSVMRACEFLKDLTPDKEKCLETFVKCGPLVQWLKESMETSGLKELKVFVDLAFMSAGDEPINIARVQCLHSAVTGYAPLIFDLDENCGYKELLKLCAIVWKELEVNPGLPKKLLDTTRQLEWLKAITQAHGSVEVTSLMQVEAINANGIFTVGKNTWKKEKQTPLIDGTIIEMSDILKLTVPEQKGKRELKNYTFSQLQDLQSRLMLVSDKAEKGSDSVDRFTMDFSTRSLDIKKESSGVRQESRQYNIQLKLDIDENESDIDDGDNDDEKEVKDSGEVENNNDSVLQAYQMRRTWESSPHPYLLFNSDRLSFTFLGFYIEKSTGNLIDQQTGRVLERGIMTQNLYDCLVRNHAPIQENFDNLPRHEKIMKLCKCMGLDMPHDPDDTYELTTDNVKKIMAIYMRFRCDIPVIIMGETGCGKTRLVKFMCSLQQPPGVDMTNMILMKVHLGTTNKDIIMRVKQADKVAEANKYEYGDHVYTILFFDEANTTEAIGLIKEIMCDKSMEGKKLKLCENLKIIAACNPYRKHSEKVIKKLEQVGLGYHVDADETTDTLGRIPMKRLVYRVQPLPQSLLPLVWDFGQLNTQVEDLYIRQMVRRYIREDKLPSIGGLIEVVSAILTSSQDYMREQKDECSFMSLRDVDRVLTVMSWFYQQSQGQRTLYDLMDEKLYGDEEFTSDDDDDDEEEEEENEQMIRDDGGGDRVDDITRSLILALGVCYHACLKTRPQYRAHIAPRFRAPCHLPGGADQIQEEIEKCQEVFLDHVYLEKNIARNMALRENVFMMVVCIELRIPLFLVGKPGSSKSLSKTIVSDAMQGNAARKELFRELKQAQMMSFQCSPLATPDGIVGTFRQCAQFQRGKDLDTFVSVVVLDEVGLAEDGPRMPLKTLHLLLEDGCQGDEEPENHMKVAFIGISNLALDPANMNRGIMVQREEPDLEELKNSANGICQTCDKLGSLIEPFIEPMAISYLDIFEKASKNMREFYGLNDFYSLVKMVYGFVEKSNQRPTWHEMLYAILRNFGGLDQVNPVKSFRENLFKVVRFDERPKQTDPDCRPLSLVQACLIDSTNTQSESRYLLLLTENYGTLATIQQILSRRGDIKPITIFGSSFRGDQEYTQVCRNINKIKVCMETGKTVILLNSENLYESLYDALNQYYVYFGGERYVDLGLGHRVKCSVHKNFRMIVVAEKQTVYKKFPLPLINRLEKHFLTVNTMLTQEQQRCVQKLENWVEKFVKQRKTTDLHQRQELSETQVGDVFIGYHDDTCSAIVLDVWVKSGNNQDGKDRDEQVLQCAKLVLLWCATHESLVRLDKSSLSNEEKKFLVYKYFEEQSHDNFIQYIKFKIVEERCEQIFTQITTHSKLMAGIYKKEVSKATGIREDRILILENLSSFDTEQQFSNRIQRHIQSSGKEPSLMVIQCDSGDVNANLIACARYCVMDEYEKMRDDLQAPVHVVFIVQLPPGASFTGFQCGVWQSVHIDDLHTVDMNMTAFGDM